jgi:glycosyltransferase involved in cell wall biosynthesis
MFQERNSTLENALRDTRESHAQLLQKNLGLTTKLLGSVMSIATRMDSIDSVRLLVEKNETLRSTLEHQKTALQSLASDHEQSLRTITDLRVEIDHAHQLDQRNKRQAEHAVASINEILGLSSQEIEKADSFEIVEHKLTQLRLLIDRLSYDLARETRTSSALSAQSDAIFKSFSWRLTRPLRTAFDLIKYFAQTERKFVRGTGVLHSPQQASSLSPRGDKSTTVATSNHGGVIVVSHDAHFAGAPMLALNLTRVLIEEIKVNVVVFLLGPGALQPRFEALCDVHTFGRDPDAIRKLTDVALSLKTERGFNFAFCNTVVTGKVCQALEKVDIPVIALVHELGASIEKMKLHEEAEALARNARKIVFPGHLVQEEFSRYGRVAQDNTVLMHQGVFYTNPYQGKRAIARKRFEKLYGNIGNSLLVVGAGYGDMRKGIDIFVRVARAICLTYDNLIFTWIGDIEPNCARSLSLKFDRHGSGTLRFVGLEPVTSNYLAAIAAADIFFLPSREDPFPSVVLDALHAGTPVLAFRNVGSFEDILDENNSVLANFLDENSIRSSIKHFCETPGLLRSLQENTLKRAAKLRTMAQYGRNLLELAEQLKH